MNQEDYITTAIENVTALNISDEEFVQIVIDQANLAAMVNPDDLWEVHIERHS